MARNWREIRAEMNLDEAKVAEHQERMLADVRVHAARGPSKTGGQDTAWVELEKPRPAPVDDRYRYWAAAPPALSERCLYWVRQIDRGWRPNRRIMAMGYDATAEWFGVYLWEWLNVVMPRLSDGRVHAEVRAEKVRELAERIRVDYAEALRRLGE